MSATLLTIQPEPPISPDVIEQLTEVCGMIERDEVSGVGIAIVHRDGSSSTVWAGPPITALIGAVERLKYRLVTSLVIE